jgi:hypothetical protein
MGTMGHKAFTADAYLQEGWTAFAHRASGLLPAHNLIGLEDAFTCRMVETVNAGELVVVDLPNYDTGFGPPDLTGGTGRRATPEEEARLIAEGSAERRD